MLCQMRREELLFPASEFGGRVGDKAFFQQSCDGLERGQADFILATALLGLQQNVLFNQQIRERNNNKNYSSWHRSVPSYPVERYHFHQLGNIEIFPCSHHQGDKKKKPHCVCVFKASLHLKVQNHSPTASASCI